MARSSYTGPVVADTGLAVANIVPASADKAQW